MIQVVCGIIYNNDQEIFIARRKPGKHLESFWEFPGGKIQSGESPISALHRELHEELGMKVIVEKYFSSNQHQYGAFQIELIAYRCEFVSATFEMTDHDKYEWVKPDNLLDWKLAPADIPIMELISNR